MRRGTNRTPRWRRAAHGYIKARDKEKLLNRLQAHRGSGTEACSGWSTRDDCVDVLTRIGSVVSALGESRGDPAQGPRRALRQGVHREGRGRRQKDRRADRRRRAVLEGLADAYRFPPAALYAAGGPTRSRHHASRASLSSSRSPSTRERPDSTPPRGQPPRGHREEGLGVAHDDQVGIQGRALPGLDPLLFLAVPDPHVERLAVDTEPVGTGTAARDPRPRADRIATAVQPALSSSSSPGASNSLAPHRESARITGSSDLPSSVSS